MALTRIDLIDAALMRIGAEPLQSEAAAGADTHIAIFESITGFCLSANPWSWNTVTRRLVQLSEPPVRYWQYQFKKPSDMLGPPRSVFDCADTRTPFTRYELNDGTLQTDAPQIWLRHDKRSAAGDWPGYFTELIQRALMAEFALSVREDRVMRAALHEEAFGTPRENSRGGLMGVAMDLDVQGKPSPVVALGNNPLFNARFQR